VQCSGGGRKQEKRNQREVGTCSAGSGMSPRECGMSTSVNQHTHVPGMNPPTPPPGGVWWWCGV